MRIVNGKIVPEYHPQILSNARAFLDRVQVNGVKEAVELTRCAELLEVIVAGYYSVEHATSPMEQEVQNDGTASSDAA